MMSRKSSAPAASKHDIEARKADMALSSDECDLLVVGSGAGGLSAAITAAYHGLRVVVAEKARELGGTTAWSGGWIFAPRNPVARRAGIDEPVDEPRRYLQAVLGNDFDPERIDAFLAAAPRMVGFFEDKTSLVFDGGLTIPDVYGQIPGAGVGGRSVIARPYDARKLGDLLPLLRHPARETTFLGLTIQAGPDLRAFMTMTRRPAAFAHVVRRVGRHFVDLATHGRALQLRNGSALVGRMIRSAADLNVSFLTGSAVEDLILDGSRVSGAVLTTPDGRREIRARRGVVLATGGFPQETELRARLFPAAQEHRTLAVPEAQGDGLRLAQSAGGRLRSDLASPGAWCPVSEVPFPDGTTGIFPHIIDRGKPGIIGVLANGKRFCNEGDGYHDYVRALIEAVPPGEEVVSWLICTRRFQRRYGLGIARPAPLSERGWIKRGYITAGRTPEELARACGIDPAGLRHTIDEFNRHAVRGEDPAFGRGSTPYNRANGDPEQGPNPCVAPLGVGPFYAVKVVPGSFGCFAGIDVDAAARVRGPDGEPISGLWAVGTDQANVMGGHYPAGGINLGPALTFGWIAGRDAAGLGITGDENT